MPAEPISINADTTLVPTTEVWDVDVALTPEQKAHINRLAAGAFAELDPFGTFYMQRASTQQERERVYREMFGHQEASFMTAPTVAEHFQSEQDQRSEAYRNVMKLAGNNLPQWAAGQNNT